jgi:hypothetical protein
VADAGSGTYRKLEADRADGGHLDAAGDCLGRNDGENEAGIPGVGLNAENPVADTGVDVMNS